MAMHWDVNCDGCGSTNLVHYRYKCLRCQDYDLCARCHEIKVETGGHKSAHPFQCLLDRAARELFFAGEVIPDLCADSFTCPVCGEMGHTAKELIKHVQCKHRSDRTQVICPLCVAVPSAHPDRVANICSHLSVVHGTGILRVGGFSFGAGGGSGGAGGDYRAAFAAASAAAGNSASSHPNSASSAAAAAARHMGSSTSTSTSHFGMSPLMSIEEAYQDLPLRSSILLADLNALTNSMNAVRTARRTSAGTPPPMSVAPPPPPMFVQSTQEQPMHVRLMLSPVGINAEVSHNEEDEPSPYV